MSEYDRRAADPCWQHKQTMIMMTTLDSHIQVIFGREKTEHTTGSTVERMLKMIFL